MAIRRVTGAVSPSELIFADANALGATYSGSGTTIERGETFTLPAGGTTAVSNGALRLEALKGDCTITNNGNSTLTNASGVNGTIVMRSGASDFPAFVRNSSMGSMSTPAREDFTGDVSGTLNNATFPAGHRIQYKSINVTDNRSTNLTTFQHISAYDLTITPQYNNSKIILFWSGNWYINGDNRHGYFTFYRDSTHLGQTTEGLRLYQTASSAGRWQNANVRHIDTPNTTSAVTYKVYIRSENTDSTFRINYNTSYFSNFSLTEIKV